MRFLCFLAALCVGPRCVAGEEQQQRMSVVQQDLSSLGYSVPSVRAHGAHRRRHSRVDRHRDGLLGPRLAGDPTEHDKRGRRDGAPA